jgi:hypothetical protein
VPLDGILEQHVGNGVHRSGFRVAERTQEHPGRVDRRPANVIVSTGRGGTSLAREVPCLISSAFSPGITTR